VIWRLASVAFALLLAGCSSGSRPPPPQVPFEASVTIDAGRPGRDANALVLGNNIQWVDRGDELLRAPGNEFAEPMLQRVQELAPAMLRYPGGAMSDTYHWKDGVGPLAERKLNEHFFSKKSQVIEMGTQEFLELCDLTGALPLITVNVASGTAREAADWVEYTNRTTRWSSRTARALPRVRYWEIGNEPYLRDDNRKELWVEPEAYARRAGEFIRAMRAVDPSIVVGIPLRSDRLGGVPATPYPGYNRKVLQAIDADFDYVALHDAYLPLGFDKSYSDDELYLGTAAATAGVEEDFAATRALLAELRPGKAVALAVTEYQALYSLGKSTDDYIATPAGAMYVADLLRVFAQTDDLAFANFWSLSGNWIFGALDREGRARPAYHVLKAYRTLLAGRLVPVKVETRTFDSPRAGLVAPRSGLPLVTAIATREGEVVRIILVNKDGANPASTDLRFADAKLGAATYVSYGGPSRFATRDLPATGVVARGALPAGGAARIDLPPHSVTLVEIRGVSS
jgi:alpha-N-arabinofuranosidase